MSPYTSFILIIFLQVQLGIKEKRLITRFVVRLTRWLPLVEQALRTLAEHLSLPTVFSGGRVTRYLALYVCFLDRCLAFCTFSFGHCVVYSSSIYEFWLPLWYLQTLLKCLDVSDLNFLASAINVTIHICHFSSDPCKYSCVLKKREFKEEQALI